MASVNKVIIIGNLGKDPEMRSFPSGDQIAQITVATTDKWKDKASGETKEATEWHRIVFTGRLAEIVGEYLRKGAQIYVEGSLRTRKYTDQSGIEKYTTEIRGQEMRMLGSRPEGGGQGNQQRGSTNQNGYDGQNGGGGYGGQGRAASTPQRPPQQPPQASSGFDDMDDDIPF